MNDVPVHTLDAESEASFEMIDDYAAGLNSEAVAGSLFDAPTDEAAAPANSEVPEESFAELTGSSTFIGRHMQRY